MINGTINNNNNISFKSKINFVDTKTFDKFRHGAYIDFRTDQIISKQEREMYNKVRYLLGDKSIKNLRHDVLKADEFYTEEVRTCPAGGVIDTRSGESAGFHTYDCLENLEQVDEILNNIFSRVPNPDRALLIGGKNLKCAPYSMPLIQAIYKSFLKRIPNVTLFSENLFPFSESNFHYSVKNDTWTIQSMFRPLFDTKVVDIQSKEDIYKCFKNVKVANGDVITFND